jgi:hypothetical protein
VKGMKDKRAKERARIVYGRMRIEKMSMREDGCDE